MVESLRRVSTKSFIFTYNFCRNKLVLFHSTVKQVVSFAHVLLVVTFDASRKFEYPESRNQCFDTFTSGYFCGVYLRFSDLNSS